MRDAKMFDVVPVSEHQLIGEIIEMHGDEASIQVYEETAGLGPGEVAPDRQALSVELGPASSAVFTTGSKDLWTNWSKSAGNSISRGATAPAIDRSKKWKIEAKCKAGDELVEGDIFATIQETEILSTVFWCRRFRGPLKASKKVSSPRTPWSLKSRTKRQGPRTDHDPTLARPPRLPLSRKNRTGEP